MALQPEVELATDEQKVSYGFGLQFGDQLKRNAFEGLDVDAVCAAIHNNQAKSLTPSSRTLLPQQLSHNL